MGCKVLVVQAGILDRQSFKKEKKKRKKKKKERSYYLLTWSSVLAMQQCFMSPTSVKIDIAQ